MLKTVHTPSASTKYQTDISGLYIDPPTSAPSTKALTESSGVSWAICVLPEMRRKISTPSMPTRIFTTILSTISERFYDTDSAVKIVPESRPSPQRRKIHCPHRIRDRERATGESDENRIKRPRKILSPGAVSDKPIHLFPSYKPPDRHLA